MLTSVHAWVQTLAPPSGKDLTSWSLLSHPAEAGTAVPSTVPSLELALLLSLRLLGPLGRTLLSPPLFGCSWSSWHPCLVHQPCSSLFTPWRNFSFKAPLVDITVSSSVLCSQQHLAVWGPGSQSCS